MKTPKGEIVWTIYHDGNGNAMFLMTSKPTRDVYYLYEIKDNSLTRLGKGMASPADLERKHNVSAAIGIGGKGNE